jgi:tetratricopeptide (TPR) repeat protein
MMNIERGANRVLDDSFNCSKCRALLPKYIGKTLGSDSEWQVEEHLATCGACFAQYAILVEKDIRKNQRESYLAGRPQPWSPPWDRQKEKDIYDALMAQALSPDRERGAGVAIIKYDKPLERVVFLLLLRLVAGLRNHGKRVRLFSSPVECLVYPEELEVLERPLCLVFLRGSGFCNALESLQELSRKGISVIAGWPNDEWGELALPINHLSYSLNLESPSSDAFSKALEEEMKAEKTLLRIEVKELYFYTCLLDAHGIPSPLSLLARLVQQSERKTMALPRRAKGLIWSVETRFPSRVFLCTAGESVARLALNTLFEDKVEQGYSRIIETINHDNQNERYLLLRLFRSMIFRGKRRLAKKLLKAHEPNITNVWKLGNTGEILLWGKIFHELFLYKEAEVIFGHGLEREPQNSYLLQAFAGALYDSGNYEKGEQLFHEASQVDPDNVYVWQSRGDKELKRRRLSYAEAWLNKALDLEPTNVYTIVSYGILKLEVGRFDEARRLFEKALSIVPRSVYALNCLAELEKRRGEFRTAGQLLTRALEVEPGNVPSLHALGQLEKERGHFKQARRLFSRILEEFDQDNIYTLHALGEIELEQGRLGGDERHYTAAEEYFNAVLEIQPENIAALVSLGVMEGHRRNYHKAEEFFSRALTKEPYNLRPLVALAELKLRQQRYREAERNLIAVLQRTANNIPALNTYARLYAETGQYALAANAFRQAVEYESQNVVTYNTWAEVEAKQGNFDKAYGLINKALELDPENAYTHRQYSLILENQGRHEEAQQQLRKTIELGMDL